LIDRIKGSSAPVIVVNMWATWCEPCKEELPDFLRVRAQHQGVELILVSTDFESELPAAQRFLADRGVDFPTFVKEGSDMEFIDAIDPRWSGALPATLIYQRGGKLVQFVEGRISYEMLERVVSGVLKSSS
jgi:thiol-disulfide isomerase/thioredoxin